MHLALIMHGRDAFTPATVVWMDLIAARQRAQADRWVSCQELVTRQPCRADMIHRVLLLWWQANILEASKGDASGRVADDDVEVDHYSFRLATGEVSTD